jgi:hypothetical protein
LYFILTLSEEAGGAGDEDALALEIRRDLLRVQATIHHHHDQGALLLLFLPLVLPPLASEREKEMNREGGGDCY